LALCLLMIDRVSVINFTICIIILSLASLKANKQAISSAII